MAQKLSYSDLGTLIRSVGTAAQEAQKKAVFNAALHMKNEIEREVRKDLGGRDFFRQMMEKKTRTGNLIGARPASNRVGVKFNVKGEYTPTALLTAYGPMGLLEYGAKAHDINARNAELAGMKRSKKKQRLVQNRELNITFRGRGAFSGSIPLRTPYGPRYRVTGHPGARPKKTFSQASERAIPRASQIATSLIQSKVIQNIRTQYGTATYVLGEQGAFKQVVG